MAMEYAPRAGNLYVSRVDAGTVELVRSFGPEVVSSGDLVQEFEATWTTPSGNSTWTRPRSPTRRSAWPGRSSARRSATSGFTTETAVQKRIMDYFADHDMVTDHPPIVGVWEHAGDPHFAPTPETTRSVEPGSFVLVDMWAKKNKPRAVYSDQTRVAFVGETVPEKVNKIFHIVAAARDAAVDRVVRAFAAGDPIQGWQVDFACRDVIDQAGYGEYFIHRTGHNIGRETHGNGATWTGSKPGRSGG